MIGPSGAMICCSTVSSQSFLSPSSPNTTWQSFTRLSWVSRLWCNLTDENILWHLLKYNLHELKCTYLEFPLPSMMEQQRPDMHCPHLKQLKKWTKCMKQWFSKIRQQTEQDSGAWNKENKQGKPMISPAYYLERDFRLQHREGNLYIQSVRRRSQGS